MHWLLLSPVDIFIVVCSFQVCIIFARWKNHVKILWVLITFFWQNDNMNFVLLTYDDKNLIDMEIMNLFYLSLKMSFLSSQWCSNKIYLKQPIVTLSPLSINYARGMVVNHDLSTTIKSTHMELHARTWHYIPLFKKSISSRCQFCTYVWHELLSKKIVTRLRLTFLKEQVKVQSHIFHIL